VYLRRGRFHRRQEVGSDNIDEQLERRANISTQKCTEVLPDRPVDAERRDACKAMIEWYQKQLSDAHKSAPGTPAARFPDNPHILGCTGDRIYHRPTMCPPFNARAPGAEERPVVDTAAERERLRAAAAARERAAREQADLAEQQRAPAEAEHQRQLAEQAAAERDAKRPKPYDAGGGNWTCPPGYVLWQGKCLSDEEVHGPHIEMGPSGP
jgi:hypothetical protein